MLGQWPGPVHPGDATYEWLASLWEGKTRALTILVGASAVAGVYALATRDSQGRDSDNRPG